MGLDIVLADCNGKQLARVDDPRNFLHRALPPADAASPTLLSKIDWYGATVFNYLQMLRFLQEWNHLRQRAETQEERELVEGVMKMAERCLNERGLLRFNGD